MGHPSIENETRFAFEPLFVTDADARPLLVPLVKATYELGPAGLVLAEEQQPPLLAGEFWGSPETSSYRFEPECAHFKPATDVALVGSACAPRVGTTEVLVAIQVGSLRAGVRVLGDRAFYRSMGTVGMTRPVPFERIPLQWERAFGGWDRSHPDEAKHSFEPRNPVGVGYRGPGARFEEGLRCPNLEDPARPFRGWGDRPSPVGVGFTSPSWEPRRRWAGTYDGDWEAQRAPGLPKDFDARFFNAAAPGLVVEGYLRGDEQVIVGGTSPEGGHRFRLPGAPAPRVRVAFAEGPDVEPELRLDTVIVDTDASKVFVLWRGQCPLQEGAHEVSAIGVRAAG